MWRALWRSIDRFSLQHFKYIINELREIKVVDKHNKELVIDLLQSVVEIVTYGDRHDPTIFECFMENQVLGEFVRVLKISRHSRIEAPLLQYLSIMIQNMESEHAIYYCLSNDYINSVIIHPYQFDGGDLAPYYVSFLRAVSSKLNRDTLCLLVKVHEDSVVSFPLYSEALKFAHHGEKMIQTAVRALTLNIYNVCDDMVYQFVTTPPVSVYFSDLVLSIKKQLVNLDNFVQFTDENCLHGRARENFFETDKIIDDFYYLEDIIRVGNSRLSKLVISNLVSLLVFPMLVSLLQLGQSNGTIISGFTSLIVIARLLQIVHEENLVNIVASAVLCVDMFSSMKNVTEGVSSGRNNYTNYLLEQLSGYMSPDTQFASLPCDNMLEERKGLITYILSDDKRLVLASLMLLLVLAENKGLDFQLAGLMGFSQTKTKMLKSHDLSDSQVVDGRSFARHLPEILRMLLMVFVTEPQYSVSIQWQTGWFLRKLLVIHGNKLDRDGIHIFNMSFEQSCERVRSELDGWWFDHIPDTLKNEWATCKRALEESAQFKDPFFALELPYHQHASCGGNILIMARQRMVNAIRVFVLHMHLKAFIFSCDPFDNPMLNLKSDSLIFSGRKYVSDLRSASFGSEVSIGSGIPCKIAFSRAGTRDIYIVPVATGTSGKLLLLEKHPLHSKRGVVIAFAPLAGLNPMKNENHPTWLHIQIREFEPTSGVSKTKSNVSNTSNHGDDGRWTLGFSDVKACDDAHLAIVEEMNKQRSFVENLIAPLLNNKPSILTESGGVKVKHKKFKG